MPTEFQRRVWVAVASVPKGKVTTYGALAAALGDKKLARAVGGALQRNPYAPDVPCHRCVKTDRSIGGFGGQTDRGALDRKRALLVSEGVRVSDKLKVDPRCLLTAPDWLTTERLAVGEQRLAANETRQTATSKHFNTASASGRGRWEWEVTRPRAPSPCRTARGRRRPAWRPRPW